MTVTKQKDGRYLVAVRPSGRSGKNIRRLCDTKSQAVRLERELLSIKHADYDNAKFSEVINLWYDFFGCNLKDGKRRLSKLNIIVSAIGDKKVSSLKAAHYLQFRKSRLDSGISPNTCNHDLAYLKAVFNKLHKLNHLTVNPFADIPLLQLDQRELSFLTEYQLRRVLVSCKKSINESLYPVTLLCLRTGCRWSEAEKLTHSQLVNGSVTFIKTKSGKSRTVPLTPEFYDYLKSRPTLWDNRLFANCLSAFRGAVDRSRVKLQRGQCSHVLRHTYASHFVMNGGDIVTLQRILGHHDIHQTMRYAHLSPDHLQDAVRFSPI